MNLNGRLLKLEAAITLPAGSERCRACGLRHVRLPIPISLAEMITRFCLGITDEAPPRLCLCNSCCAEGHVIARLTYARSPRGAA